jgi:uncharacterized membrane protein YphA (DoxX/SURF4 family)
MQRLKRILLSLWSYRLIRILLGMVFVWAGAAKLMDPEGFAHIISAYQLVPEALLAPAAIGLPALEFMAGLGLIFDIRGSLTVILGLLGMFAFVLWFGILKDLDIDCGCFSAEELAEHGALRWALYRDLGMMIAVLYLFWWRRATRSVPRAGFRIKASMAHLAWHTSRKEKANVCVTEKLLW